VEFASALEATRCAVEIQRTLSERNQVQPAQRDIRLRIGIHIGEVVHKNGKVMGDAVNIAARLEPLAPAGGICVSNAVFEQVRNKLEQTFASLGPAELKNIELPMAVHRVVMPWERGAETGSISTARPSGARVGSTVSQGVPQRRTRMLTLLALGAVGVAGLTFGWKFVHQRRSSSPATKATLRIASLAVKPLDDISGDTNQAYFSDGMTEALCAALGNISALRVPGRSSVMRYKASTKSIPEMAKELRVDAIVEGSVQRAANRMLVTVQLVEASTDRHLWATNYNRDLSDFFQVQNELALALEIEKGWSGEPKARVYARIGKKKEALAALEQAFEEKQPGLYSWRCDPLYDDLRSEPQAIELSRKMGFEK
jgi:TolB-like protein